MWQFTGGNAIAPISDAPLATLQSVGYNLLWVSIQNVKREA
jgi:hypothetical protein